MESRIDLASRIDGTAAADAIRDFLDSSTAHRSAWHSALAEILAPGRRAVVEGSEVLETFDLSPLELDGDEPAPYLVTVRVNADVEVQEDGGPVVEEHRDEDVALRILATLAPSGVGDDVELLVHDVAPPPPELAD
jgi:hypothetical protein